MVSLYSLPAVFAQHGVHVSRLALVSRFAIKKKIYLVSEADGCKNKRLLRGRSSRRPLSMADPCLIKRLITSAHAAVHGWVIV